MTSKSKVDKHFQDNWTATKVQYEGAKFDLPTNNKWVSVSFVPYDRSIIGYAGANSRKEDNALIVVRCYDTSPTLSMILAEEVQTFLECKKIDDIIVDLGISDGNGAIPLHDGIFELTLNFKTRKFT